MSASRRRTPVSSRNRAFASKLPKSVGAGRVRVWSTVITSIADLHADRGARQEPPAPAAAGKPFDVTVRQAFQPERIVAAPHRVHAGQPVRDRGGEPELLERCRGGS